MNFALGSGLWTMKVRQMNSKKDGWSCSCSALSIHEFSRYHKFIRENIYISLNQERCVVDNMFQARQKNKSKSLYPIIWNSPFNKIPEPRILNRSLEEIERDAQKDDRSCGVPSSTSLSIRNHIIRKEGKFVFFEAGAWQCVSNIFENEEQALHSEKPRIFALHHSLFSTCSPILQVKKRGKDKGERHNHSLHSPYSLIGQTEQESRKKEETAETTAASRGLKALPTVV